MQVNLWDKCQLFQWTVARNQVCFSVSCKFSQDNQVWGSEMPCKHSLDRANGLRTKFAESANCCWPPLVTPAEPQKNRLWVLWQWSWHKMLTLQALSWTLSMSGRPQRGAAWVEERLLGCPPAVCPSRTAPKASICSIIAAWGCFWKASRLGHRQKLLCY